MWNIDCGSTWPTWPIWAYLGSGAPGIFCWSSTPITTGLSETSSAEPVARFAESGVDGRDIFKGPKIEKKEMLQI
jgi:hypothetical protein